MDSDLFPFPLTHPYSHIHLKSEGEKLLLILPHPSKDDDWSQLYQDLKYCLSHNDMTWEDGTAIHLMVHDRLLDTRQLQTLAEILQDAKLSLQWVYTSRRQTAVAAATAGYSVQQQLLSPPSLTNDDKPAQLLISEPLYLKTTVRSGTQIRHLGSIIISGDINPGADVIAGGDIIIWGTLRGVAHAGAKGNPECCIMALRMNPTQLRIAESVARAPASTPDDWEPEIAYLTPEGIRITTAYNFTKTHIFQTKAKGWREK